MTKAHIIYISLISFMKRLNNMGLMLHPCFSFTFEGKTSDIPLGSCTLNLIFLYMFLNKETNFALTPYPNNFLNSASSHILSNAFLKSTTQKYNFLLFLRYLSITVLIVNTRSAVSKPLRKPIWLIFKMLLSLIKHSSLLFRRRLKSLLRQLLIVMPR